MSYEQLAGEEINSAGLVAPKFPTASVPWLIQSSMRI